MKYSDISYYMKNEEFNGFSFEIAIKNFVHRERSKFQLIEVVDTVPFGRALITDGILMITELDEVIYHEMIVHVPLSLVKFPKNVLIIGGGDGGCVREVSKYECVERIDLVEIDEKILGITQKYFKTWEGVNHQKLNIYIEDGFKFLEKTSNIYDVVLIDISAPIDIAKSLYSKDSFEKIIRILSDEGVFVIQSESVYVTPNVAKYILNQIKDLVKFSGVYSVWVPSFLSPWSFIIGSKGNRPDKPKYINLDSMVFSKMKAYSEEYHIASFSLPPFIKNYLFSDVYLEFSDLLNRNLLRKILK
ncbi:MAG: polyamine aminopropyltransferase [Brevinematia bacterium]